MKALTLIGMPGSGKSTVGKAFAKKNGFRFVDLDALILKKEGKSHVAIMKEKGEKELLKLEEIYTLGLDFSSLVFSPGGSIVYSPKAMKKIKEESKIIYLELPLEEIKKRLGNEAENRGIVGFVEKGIDGIFRERAPLYKDCADVTLNCFGLSIKGIIKKIDEIL